MKPTILFLRQSLILVAVFAGLNACTPPKKSTKTPDITAFMRYSPTWKPMISIHRGGGEEAGVPENCLESFQHYAKQFPCIIECDVRLTKDSVMVLLHDATLDRTTNGTGKLQDYTYAEIKEMLLEDNDGQLTTYGIPTLEEVLRWGKGKVIFTLDVKRETPFAKVVEMVRKTNAQNASVIITYDAKDARTVYDLAPELMISVTARTQTEYDRLAEMGVPDNRMVAFIGTREPNAEFNKFLHQKGILTILGTLGNLDEKAANSSQNLYAQWVGMGADIIATDRPNEAFSGINRY